MEMWMNIIHGDIKRMFKVSQIQESDGEVIYSTTDHGTIYHTVDGLYILDINVGQPTDISVVFMH